jgi:hypothetical protein
MWRRVSYIRNKFWDEHEAIIIFTKYKTLCNLFFSVFLEPVPWFMWLGSGPYTRRVGFYPRPVYVKSMVDKLGLRQIFLRLLQVFPRQYHSTTAPYLFIHSFIHSFVRSLIHLFIHSFIHSSPKPHNLSQFVASFYSYLELSAIIWTV